MQFGPNDLLVGMGVKSKCVLFSHEGRVVMTGIKIKLLEGIITLVVNIAGKVVVSSTVCTGMS